MSTEELRDYCMGSAGRGAENLTQGGYSIAQGIYG